MLLLGLDIGSSSVKSSVIDGESGDCIASAFYPKEEMAITAIKPGWAEQDPGQWWKYLKDAVADCINQLGPQRKEIGAVGISYQMHGLVTVGRDLKPLRPSIIWCDSRAVSYGQNAFESLGKDYVLSHLLNSPGNFTASKLAWVKENESDIYSRIYKIMLPGDYIALQLTGEVRTSLTGLSEGIFWDFPENSVSGRLLEHFGFDQELLPEAIPSLSVQGYITSQAAAETGLPMGIPVSYRAGDQPNNALSLNVMEPGEVAATAGTSGVIYGVTDQLKFDPLSRVNTFLHVNHAPDRPRLGVLLCINGTGILNSWLRKISGGSFSYSTMNEMAAGTSPGADGLTILPFGNGSERMLGNKDTGARISGLNFNTHGNAHLFRAVQEGIVFSFKHGLEIMRETGSNASVIRAGMANMFLSPLFREALATVTGAEIHLYNTDGSAGAARGAGIGCGYYKSAAEAFGGLRETGTTFPDKEKAPAYMEAYNRWNEELMKL